MAGKLNTQEDSIKKYYSLLGAGHRGHVSTFDISSCPRSIFLYSQPQADPPLVEKSATFPPPELAGHYTQPDPISLHRVTEDTERILQGKMVLKKDPSG